VQHGQQGTFVFVIEDGKAEIRPVTMGLTEGNDATVKSGVKPGDMVVTDGQDKLQDGSLVTTRATTRTTGGRTQKNP
jgi:multidrug efflux system membrane fusion protein